MSLEGEGTTVELLLTTLMVALAATLLWKWWVTRGDRDPAGSVDSFHRALSAMRPETGDRRGPARSPAGPRARRPARAPVGRRRA